MSEVPEDEAPGRYQRAIARFREIHATDPRRAEEGTVSEAYHARVASCVARLDAGASEVVRLAAWAQHLRRWEVPRTQFPEGGAGYRRWRAHLTMRQVAAARQVLMEEGYTPAECDRVGAILAKRDLRCDPEAALLEDAVCLVFFEYEAAAFAARHAEAAVAEIVRKTLAKMTPRGHEAVAGLVARLPDALRGVLAAGLAAAGAPEGQVPRQGPRGVP